MWVDWAFLKEKGLYREGMSIEAAQQLIKAYKHKETGTYQQVRDKVLTGKKPVKPKEGTVRIVYGKAEGQKYTVKSGNEYVLTGERSGETKIVPENKTDVCMVYEAPRCAGFKDGKYVGDENINTIYSNGRIVLNSSAFNNERNSQVTKMIQHEVGELSGVIQSGTFFRGTNNDKEIQYLKNGTIKPSVNHSSNEAEDGLSVWEDVKYPFKHLYRVSGDVISVGADGEPVLDTKTVKFIEQIDYKDVYAAYDKGKKKFAETYGWTAKQTEDAWSGQFDKSRL